MIPLKLRWESSTKKIAMTPLFRHFMVHGCPSELEPESLILKSLSPAFSTICSTSQTFFWYIKFQLGDSLAPLTLWSPTWNRVAMLRPISAIFIIYIHLQNMYIHLQYITVPTSKRIAETLRLLRDLSTFFSTFSSEKNSLVLSKDKAAAATMVQTWAPFAQCPHCSSGRLI